MCGIAGWVDWKKNLLNQGKILENMTNCLANRGPDDRGIYLSPQAALGHRRLVVLDPEGGAQPMSRSQGEYIYTISYNGELYNSLELRQELEVCGQHFLSRNSDTETILVAYMEWGSKCVERFNGIFAFAIWDEKNQSMFLARDRLGVKPLFYSQQGKSLLFASELKALLAHPAVQPEVEREGLAEIFIMGPARTPGHGIFRGIEEIKPGYCMLYNRNGAQLRKYWGLESHVHEDDIDTTALWVRELLENAVSRQLVADVPVCTLLSGGLDSSAITAFAARGFQEAGLENLHTLSVDYIDNEQHFRPGSFQPDSDAMWVKKVTKALGTYHHYIEIDNIELADALFPAMLANDLPGMADIDSSLYLFCREIKKMATVALSGECADEIFGGYPWFHRREMLNTDSFPWIRAVEERTALLSPDLENELCAKDYLRRRYLEAIEELPCLVGEDSFNTRIRELFYLNITRFMPTLLDRKDRMSMACGLEVRVPFSDHKLLEYVWNIPWSMKSCDGMSKGILRRALNGILPADVLLRPKSPYPKTHHPLYLARVQKELLQILNEQTSPLLPLVKGELLKTLLSSGQDIFTRPWFGQLMGNPQYLAYLIQVNAWLKEYNVIIR